MLNVLVLSVVMLIVAIYPLMLSVVILNKCDCTDRRDAIQQLSLRDQSYKKFGPSKLDRLKRPYEEHPWPYCSYNYRNSNHFRSIVSG
jgi:hypothetical protein